MHSPEPWKAHPHSGPAPNFQLLAIVGADNKTFYAGTSGETFEQSLANVERITACVNFCRGISTEELVCGSLVEQAKDIVERNGYSVVVELD